MRIGISHINPLIMKPHKVGISPENADAYVLFGSLTPYILHPTPGARRDEHRKGTALRCIEGTEDAPEALL